MLLLAQSFGVQRTNEELLEFLEASRTQQKHMEMEGHWIHMRSALGLWVRGCGYRMLFYLNSCFRTIASYKHLSIHVFDVFYVSVRGAP